MIESILSIFVTANYRMKTFILSILFLISGFIVSAQSDSVRVSTINPEYDFLYKELFNFSPNSTFGSLELEIAAGLQSNLNFKPNLVFNLDPFSSMKTLSLSNGMPFLHPFVNQLEITNQKQYQLNDKLSLGGSSFVGNSVFNPLPANPSLKDMSIYGASMFLEYKVSKKFKIGGGFSITNQNQPGIW